MVRVPRSALHRNDSVFIVDQSNQLHSKAIDYIHLDDTHLIVTKGLKNGDNVVLTRLALMSNKMQVRISTENVLPRDRQK